MSGESRALVGTGTMSGIARLALPLLMAVAACDSSDLSAVPECATVAREYSGTVAGSFNSTVGAIRRLEGQAELPRWPNVIADQSAVLCYFDAQIAKAPPPGPNGEIHEPFDRVIVAIVDGKSELNVAGYRDAVPVRAP